MTELLLISTMAVALLLAYFLRKTQHQLLDACRILHGLIGRHERLRTDFEIVVNTVDDRITKLENNRVK